MGNTLIPSKAFTELWSNIYSDTTTGKSVPKTYNEYVFEILKNGTNRVCMIYVPKAFLDRVSLNATIAFDAGGYASSSAYSGISIWIKVQASDYLVGGNWAVTETGAGNIQVVVYAR